jgi:spore germination protein KB
MNRQEGKIDYREGLGLAFAAIATKTFLQVPSAFVAVGEMAAWQLPLVATLVSLVAFLPLVALLRRFPGQGIGAIAEETAGWFGVLLTLAMALYFSVLGSVVLRNVAETFIATLLPETPPSVFLLALTGCAAFSSYRGIETLGRTASLFLPVSVLVVVSIVLLSWNRFHWPWLFPFWGRGFDVTIADGTLAAGGLSEVVILAAIGYAFRSAPELDRAGRNAILLSGLMLFAITIALVLSFGRQEAAEQSFPAYMIARNIYLGRFFQRVESLFVVAWFFGAAIKLSVLFHGSLALLTDALRLPAYRPVIPALAVLWYAGSLLPEDIQMLFDIQTWFRSWGGWMLYGSVALLLLIAAARGKKGGAVHAP